MSKQADYYSAYNNLCRCLHANIFHTGMKKCEPEKWDVRRNKCECEAYQRISPLELSVLIEQLLIDRESEEAFDYGGKIKDEE